MTIRCWGMTMKYTVCGCIDSDKNVKHVCDKQRRRCEEWWRTEYIDANCKTHRGTALAGDVALPETTDCGTSETETASEPASEPGSTASYVVAPEQASEAEPGPESEESEDEYPCPRQKTVVGDLTSSCRPYTMRNASGHKIAREGASKPEPVTRHPVSWLKVADGYGEAGCILAVERRE